VAFRALESTGTRVAGAGRPPLSFHRPLIAVVAIAMLVLGCGGESAQVSSTQPSTVVGATPSAKAIATAAATATEQPTPTPTEAATPEPTAEPTPEPTPEPTAKPTPRPTPEPTPKPIVYATLSDRSWQKVVKAPDSYLGRTYQIWACITQFDAATGLDTFRGQGSNKKLEYWYSDGDNTLFTGDEDRLSDFVQDDLVYLKVTVLGSYSYDTQVGGNTTVPWFEVDKIARKGSCD
jgi:hypothetical protein